MSKAVPLRQAKKRAASKNASTGADSGEPLVLDPKAPPDGEAPEFSEEAIALLFAELHADSLRYVAAWGKWLIWEEEKGRWRVDDTLHVFDLVRRLCREQSMLVSNARAADDIASAKTVAAVERLSRADRRLAATVGQWDLDIWLLNTPAGVVDLRTGRTRPAKREDYITKCTASAPGGDCPTWLAFLERVTGGDKELERYLQRVAGYGLTGSTQEHALFFLFGTGANGKSVFIGALSGLLGDYATVAPMETFIASNSDRHPTELAGLQGARLVTAVETEEGRRWAESRIAALTGGDKVTARFMRQDFFEFHLQCKFVIAGNHKPGLRSVGEAMRRRMNLVPFTVTIPEDERDDTLKEKLRAEWPGILAWAIEGAGEWQGEGLAQPQAVRDATASYIDAEDALGQWMAECCNVSSSYYALVRDLFASWRRWADKAGEFIGSQKRFSQLLSERGFAPRKEGGSGRAGFDGIGVRIEYTEGNPLPNDGAPQ
jgi:putative DNA primase/helicase